MTPRDEGADGRHVDNASVRREAGAPGNFQRVRVLLATSLLTLTQGVILVPGAEGAIGIFEDHRDIGKPSQAGAATHDGATGFYIVSGGGENMWFTNDALHFVSTRRSGDFVLEASIDWLGTGGNAHRKACLIAREDDSPDAAYVDVAVHGDGLTSLQFREAKGGPTREIQASLPHSGRVALGRQGDTFWMAIQSKEGAWVPAGPFIRLPLKDPVHLGLGVCAHDDRVLEKARFGHVRITAGAANENGRLVLHSTLETIAIGSKDRRAVHTTKGLIEAPNWSRDGRHLYFNGQGRIHRLALVGGALETVETGFANRCNNDHGISPDGTQLVISDQSRTGKSLIYVLPIEGGTPRLVTPLGPSYWHGWSPDGKTLVYCAERQGEYDVYTIPVDGGEERRLTTAAGLDDGPEYSADGQWIYFNSDRGGLMQIWRMRADGSDQQAVTADDFNNWFPHPSPDGRWLVFLSYEKDVVGHPANKNVQLRIMPLGGGPIQVLARLYGGQGTINVPSWSPDSRQLAFVSYAELQP